MVTMSALHGEKRAEILQLARQHGAHSIRVFGSVVRGGNLAGSDVDFLVEFEPGRTLFDLIRLRLDLRDLLGAEVEVVTPASLHYIRDRVLAEATLL